MVQTSRTGTVVITATCAALGASLGAAGVLAHFRDRIRPGLAYRDIREGFLPLPYLMDPETDCLVTASELSDGMEAIEENPGQRLVFGQNRSVFQEYRAQEMFTVQGIHRGISGLIAFNAVWPDGYTETRQFSSYESVIVRKEEFRAGAQDAES